jgi:hypothetical protein
MLLLGRGVVRHLRPRPSANRAPGNWPRLVVSAANLTRAH